MRCEDLFYRVHTMNRNSFLTDKTTIQKIMVGSRVRFSRNYLNSIKEDSLLYDIHKKRKGSVINIEGDKFKVEWDKATLMPTSMEPLAHLDHE